MPRQLSATTSEMVRLTSSVHGIGMLNFRSTGAHGASRWPSSDRGGPSERDPLLDWHTSRTPAGSWRQRMASARPMTDRDEIRSWAEARNARPACVQGTGRRSGDTGMIRLDFPGYSGAESLQEVSWDEWFRQFDENNLALLVQDETAGGGRSNFNKLVSRDSVRGAASSGSARRKGTRPAGRSSAAQSRSRKGAAQRRAAAAKSGGSRRPRTSGSSRSSFSRGTTQRSRASAGARKRSARPGARKTSSRASKARAKGRGGTRKGSRSR